MYEHPSTRLELARQRRQGALAVAKEERLARAGGRDRKSLRPLGELGALTRILSGAVAGVARRGRAVPQRSDPRPTA
jgi:hypothetical protein